MDPVSIDNLVQLARANAWIPLLAIVVGGIVRMAKDDPAVAKIPLYFKPENRAIWAMGLAVAGAALDRLATGGTWYDAIAGGLVAGSGAIAGHELLVKRARKGRDIGIKKDPPAPPNDWTDDSERPPPAGGGTVYPAPRLYLVAVAACAIVMLGSCSWLGQACRVVDLADNACEFVPVRLEDGSIEYVPRDRLRTDVAEIRAARAADAGAR
jgi:hypothetical protein